MKDFERFMKETFREHDLNRNGFVDFEEMNAPISRHAYRQKKEL